jgi:hypothetical protein
VETDGRWRVWARGRFAKAAIEGCREKIVGERVDVVDGVLNTDWGLETNCVALEIR